MSSAHRQEGRSLNSAILRLIQVRGRSSLLAIVSHLLDCLRVLRFIIGKLLLRLGRGFIFGLLHVGLGLKLCISVRLLLGTRGTRTTIEWMLLLFEDFRVK